jgi:cystathionine beta-lyase/cystathionine gamma-synthase
MAEKTLPENIAPGTICVHSGTFHDDVTGGVNSPIFTSSSYEYLDREDTCYPRYFNTPNQEVVVAKLSNLEHAEAGVLFSSGMAAISTTILSFAGRGDHVVLLDELYGGTHAFVTDCFDRLGIGYTFVKTSVDAVARAITADTRVIVIESPTNPLMNIIDIEAVAGLGIAHGVVTVMDNTFATPINQKPLALGIDVVVHSGTKYLGGHSDLCCGVALGSREHTQTILAMARHLGGSLNGIHCYLLERSLKTLALRVERHCLNARRIGAELAAHDAVRRVYYPGLPGCSGHKTALKQMKGFGGMLSFELADEGTSPNAFLKRLRLVRPAVSLGGVESLICAPAHTSHAKLSAAERHRLGITDGLLRLSVGIEEVDDILADLDQALR